MQANVFRGLVRLGPWAQLYAAYCTWFFFINYGCICKQVLPSQKWNRFGLEVWCESSKKVYRDVLSAMQVSWCAEWNYALPRRIKSSPWFPLFLRLAKVQLEPLIPSPYETEMWSEHKRSGIKRTSFFSSTTSVLIDKKCIKNMAVKCLPRKF